MPDGPARILQVAVAIFLGGAAGITWAVMHWASLGFGPIPYNLVMRVLVIALTAVTVAIQLAASGFLASMFTLRR